MNIFFVCDFRRWIQAVFRLSDDVNSSSSTEAALKKQFPGQEYIQPKVEDNPVMGLVDNSEIDISEGVAVDMFGISPSNDNEVKFVLLPFIFLVALKFPSAVVTIFSHLCSERRLKNSIPCICGMYCRLFNSKFHFYLNWKDMDICFISRT